MQRRGRWGTMCSEQREESRRDQLQVPMTGAAALVVAWRPQKGRLDRVEE